MSFDQKNIAAMPMPLSIKAPAPLGQLLSCPVRLMAFPQSVLYGVLVRLPESNKNRVRMELRRRLGHKPGEHPQRLALRAMAALSRMGIRGSPVGYPKVAPRGPHKPKGSHLFQKVRKGAQNASVPAKAPGCNSPTSAIGDQNPHGPPKDNGPLGPKLAIGDQKVHKGALKLAKMWGFEVARADAHGTVKLLTEDESAFMPKEFLGAGSCGSVWAGTSKLGSKTSPVEVAVKVMWRDQTQKTEKAIAMEIRCLKDLAHPCILHLYGVTATTFNVQLFLRRYEMSLHDLLQQEPIEAKAKRITRHVLRGLAYMHAKGYVHRDLKSGNILVNSWPLAAVIADLGSAYFGEDGQRTVTTITSRAPEIMLGFPFGKTSDIWSLGCTLAEVEQKKIFHGPMRAFRDLDGDPHGQEYAFMKEFAEILGVSGFAPYPLRGGGLLQLGPMAEGVVGTRFSKEEFHDFIEKMLRFQPLARATVHDLLGDPWLQTRDASGDCGKGLELDPVD